MKNRLRLNFSLETVEERKNFLEEYLKSPQFQKNPPNENELETIANYLLWGKDSSGKAVGKDLNIKTKKGTWDKKENIESLDELQTQINFNEGALKDLKSPSSITKIKKQTFSRKEALQKAPPYILDQLKALWREIDEVDLLINYYDLKTGKRINPIREELLNRFTKEEQEKIQKAANKLNPFSYLKKRHQLVELRRDQFVYKDFYNWTINPASTFFYSPEGEKLTLDFNFKVLPFGLLGKNKTLNRIFELNPNPKTFSKEELKIINDYYWKTEEDRKARDSKNHFDFRRLEDVYQLLQFYLELKNEEKESQEQHQIENNLGDLFRTLEFYLQLADLTDVQKKILNLKVRKYPNEVIKNIVNQEYGKSYTTNYISTIYRHKIIERVNAAAEFHEEIIGNLWFPENFKKCATCGEVLLLNSRNFIRKSKSKDGFNSRCKFCERRIRQEKKKNS